MHKRLGGFSADCMINYWKIRTLHYLKFIEYKILNPLIILCGFQIWLKLNLRNASGNSV